MQVQTNPKQIKRILIANRGEIAVRVIKTIRKLGLCAIAVYSDFDRNAQHVLQADEAINIGGNTSAESYLSIDNVIRAAKETSADAIHPGFGFLSENADFVRRCQAEGLNFIGPSAEAMEIMGDKASAKAQMLKHDVPCIQGYQGNDQSNEKFIAEADKIGFPVMVKAAAGGGGRGMRLVERADLLEAALDEARQEALAGFGSDVLILEQAVKNAKHIEFQIVGDNHGNVIHLGERDCSLQRRHQKVIEEAPSPSVDADLRARMGEAAVQAAQSVSYVGAGTIEFLLDDKGNFYFLEMNTRLQVEHPVTEMITGLDLVELQIRIADGEPIGINQNDVQLDGHAIEARIYAEDPGNDFTPSTGMVELWSGSDNPKYRIDSGIVTGDEIGPFYDPMVAKIITFVPGEDAREKARKDLIDALSDIRFLGLKHNKSYLRTLLQQPEFIDGSAHIKFIDEEFEYQPITATNELACVAALCAFAEKYASSKSIALSSHNELQNWNSIILPPVPFFLKQGDAEFRIQVSSIDADTYHVKCNDFESRAHCEPDGFRIGGGFYRVGAFISKGGKLFASIDGSDWIFDDGYAAEYMKSTQKSDGTIAAPMHGVLVELRVSEGQQVQAGDCVAVLEAMKMRHEIFADIAGTVEGISAQQGAQVVGDEVLFNIAPEQQ